MKIEEFEKLTKVNMVDIYKKQLQSAQLGLEADYKIIKKYKDGRDEVRKECEKLKDERDTANNEMAKRVEECNAIRKEIGVLGEELNDFTKNYEKLNKEHNKLKQLNGELKTLVNDLEAELERKTIPQTEPEDGDLDGVPWSQLPEDKLVEVVRSQGAMLNKQARKLKKYKKSNK